MSLSLKETSPYVFTAANHAGASLTITATPELSGDALGMRPTELLPCALASCTSIDLRLIIEKQRQRIDSLETEINMQRDENQTPKVITHIRLTYKLRGEIDADKARRALELASEKYCTVYKHLSPTIAIDYRLEINGEPC